LGFVAAATVLSEHVAHITAIAAVTRRMLRFPRNLGKGLEQKYVVISNSSYAVIIPVRSALLPSCFGQS
jgi:hypothetical protein